MTHFKTFFGMVACVSFLSLCGCFGSNSDIGSVTGTVTLDGEPIEWATVTFKPTQGRGSIGVTDANGVYTLGYIRNQNGALIGNHKVVIRTEIVKSPYGDGEESEGAVEPTPRKEMLPKKHSDWKKTELTATVESGSNTIDFPLSTK